MELATLELRSSLVGCFVLYYPMLGQALAETLASNLTLKRLDLAENKFGSASASFLAAALDTNTCLESLSCVS